MHDLGWKFSVSVEDNIDFPFLLLMNNQSYSPL